MRNGKVAACESAFYRAHTHGDALCPKGMGRQKK